ncbi:MAG: L,D-transpeptidase family protein [Thermoleophilia bacterium]|nr:L,D-transpeptidase family protein [Thermoleophilia bacterium]
MNTRSAVMKLSLSFTLVVLLLMAFGSVAAYGATGTSAENYPLANTLITADCINGSCLNESGTIDIDPLLNDESLNISPESPDAQSNPVADSSTPTDDSPLADSASGASGADSQDENVQTAAIDTQTPGDADIQTPGEVEATDGLTTSGATAVNSGLDLFYGYDRSNTGLWSFDATGTGLSAPHVDWLSGSNNWDWSRTKAVTVDRDGDGNTEIAAFYGYDRAQTGLWIFDPTPSGYAAPRLVWLSGENNWEWSRSRLTAADVNGDGKTELAVLYGYDRSQTGLWLFDPTVSGFSAPRPVWFSGVGNWDWSRSKLAAVDNNGDGRTELAVLYGYDRSNTGLWLFDPSGTGYTAPHPVWFSGIGNWDWSRSKLATVDFNNDGRIELAVIYGYDRANTGLWLFDPSGAGYASPRANWFSGERNWEWLRSKVQTGDHFMPRTSFVSVSFIEINISNQTLSVHSTMITEVEERFFVRSDAPYRTFLVCTGAPGSDTPAGTYYINSKYVANDMSGGSGSSYYYAPGVPYVLWFIDKMYSIHGAPWVSEFGVRRSHGCVNLPMPAAEWLFSVTPVGTQVWIHY